MATLGLSVGALCAGYGGIEIGLSNLIETEMKWFADIDQSSSKVIKKHFGDIPNLGDITEIATTREKPFEVPECDIVTAGFPCQPVSLAGARKGVKDERWLIEDVCRVASVAKAKWLILENVAGILTANNGNAMGRVCAEMAFYGFNKWEWLTLRASDIGACHRRERWFCVATNTDSERSQGQHARNRLSKASKTADSPGSNYVGDSPGRLGKYKEYETGIRRWELVSGRLVPDILLYKHANGSTKVNPLFVEWMMGLPLGWVTDVDLSYTAKLELLGNGVVPQQATLAITTLFRRLYERKKTC